MTPDEVLAELLEIRAAQSNLSPDSAEYRALESRREQLVADSRDALDQTKGRQALEAELAHLKTRLSALADEKIDTPSWQVTMSERNRFAINDPAAHTSQINAALDRKTEHDRDAIESRIEQIKNILED